MKIIGFFTALLFVCNMGPKRADIRYYNFSDGSSLCLSALYAVDDRSNIAEIKADLRIIDKKGSFVGLKWSSKLTDVKISKNKDDEKYALIGVDNNRLLVFLTWNKEFFYLDKKSGKILDKGCSDACLKDFESLIPLKIFVTNLPYWNDKLFEEELKKLIEEEKSKEKSAINKK